MRKLKIIQVKSELGAGTRGSSLGVEALKLVAAEMHNSYFADHENIKIATLNHLLFKNHITVYAKKIEPIIEICTKTAEKIKETILKKDFPLVLSGDHSTSCGTISGIKIAYPEKKIGTIWIDAHADLHSPYTTPSGNLHGMPLAAVLNEDNIKNQKNLLDEKHKKLWNDLKNIGNIKPKIHYSDLVFMGLRAMETEEQELIEKNNVKVFIVDAIRKHGAEHAAENCLKYLSHCDLIYISFDVDCLDPSISIGTGTPAPCGLNVAETSNMISHLLKNKKVCCLEVVEINPLLDVKNSMAKIAFEIINKAAAIIEA